jgi:hypothetical protein
MNFDWQRSYRSPSIRANVIVGHLIGQASIGTTTRNNEAAIDRSRCGSRMSTWERHRGTLDPLIARRNIFVHCSSIPGFLVISVLTCNSISKLMRLVSCQHAVETQSAALSLTNTYLRRNSVVPFRRHQKLSQNSYDSR